MTNISSTAQQEFETVMALWERSVRATYHFLNEAKWNWLVASSEQCKTLRG